VKLGELRVMWLYIEQYEPVLNENFELCVCDL